MINLNFRTLLYFRENLFKYSNSLISDTPRVGLRGMDFVLTRTLEIVIFYRPYTASNASLAAKHFRRTHSITGKISGNIILFPGIIGPLPDLRL